MNLHAGQKDRNNMNPWYETLNRPPLTPPNWIFGPVWTILYITIIVSIILYYLAKEKKQVAATSVLLGVHLASNFVWTWLFFGLQSPGAALADIIFLDCSLVVLIWLFCRARKIAGLILIPYLLWVSFATYLNAGFWVLN